MNKQPTHNAYVVTQYESGGERRSRWHRVGTVWPHKDGVGFDIVITDGISVSGRVVCTSPREQADMVAG